MMRRAEGALLLVFEGLTRAPSKECGRCLLTKFGLAQFTARLGFWKLGYERHLAFNIFDAVTTHMVAGGYTRPIHTPHNILSTRAFTAKPPDGLENRRLCLSAQTMRSSKNIVGAVEPEENTEKMPVRPRYHTPARRGVGTNWVDTNFSPAITRALQLHLRLIGGGPGWPASGSRSRTFIGLCAKVRGSTVRR